MAAQYDVYLPNTALELVFEQLTHILRHATTTTALAKRQASPLHSSKLCQVRTLCSRLGRWRSSFCSTSRGGKDDAPMEEQSSAMSTPSRSLVEREPPPPPVAGGAVKPCFQRAACDSYADTAGAVRRCWNIPPYSLPPLSSQLLAVGRFCWEWENAHQFFQSRKEKMR